MIIYDLGIVMTYLVNLSNQLESSKLSGGIHFRNSTGAHMTLRNQVTSLETYKRGNPLQGVELNVFFSNTLQTSIHEIIIYFS